MTMSRKRFVWLSVTVLVVLALGCGSWALASRWSSSSEAKDQPQSFTGTTQKIEKGPLNAQTSATGTLKYADTHSVASSFEGVLTALPQAGEVLQRGAIVSQVGDDPTYLMYGSTPAWRDLSIDTTNGEDVRQLEENLSQLGFFRSAPDNAFTWETHRAVVAWQKSVGLRPTGVLQLGRILFEKGEIRVGQLSARNGDRVSTGTELYKASSTTQIVEAHVKLSDQNLAQMGGKVSLNLPGATTVPATITSIGTPIEQGTGDKKQRVIPITVAPDDPASTSEFQEVSVTVGLPSLDNSEVLSVPVSALIAIDANRFGVEVVDKEGNRKIVEVTTGAFAAGRVAISGEGIHEGQDVVVPSL